MYVLQVWVGAPLSASLSPHTQTAPDWTCAAAPRRRRLHVHVAGPTLLMRLGIDGGVQR